MKNYEKIFVDDSFGGFKPQNRGHSQVPGIYYNENNENCSNMRNFEPWASLTPVIAVSRCRWR